MSNNSDEQMSPDEAMRCIRLKLEVRKGSWPCSPNMVCWVEIREVETLISEVERLRANIKQMAPAYEEWLEWQPDDSEALSRG